VVGKAVGVVAEDHDRDSIAKILCNNELER
jgi:hypothetical protein